MKYFSIFSADRKTNAAPPTPQQREAMHAFMQDSVARGEFISGGGFLPVASDGLVMRRRNGQTHIVDGPYVETKEVLGGFAMLQYDSREAAIDGARRFMAVAGDGECVTYRIADDPTHVT